MTNLTSRAIEILDSLLALPNEELMQKFAQHESSDFGSMLEYAGYFNQGSYLQDLWYGDDSKPEFNLEQTGYVSATYSVGNFHSSYNVFDGTLTSKKAVQVNQCLEPHISSHTTVYFQYNVSPEVSRDLAQAVSEKLKNYNQTVTHTYSNKVSSTYELTTSIILEPENSCYQPKAA